MKRLMMLVFLSAVLLAGFASSVSANTLCVNPGGTGGCYSTIQDAINAANPTGDTINVAAGTYAGQINVNKSVTILGNPGDASPGPGLNAPVIDGGSAYGDAFLLDNGVSNVTIQGFEIRNFATISGDYDGVGNAISAWEASTSNITIQDNYFHHLGYNGVLVGNDGAAGDHTNWLIKGNIIENFGYIGFELTNTSNSSIEDNVIHMSTPYIGAIFSSARRSETGLTIKNNLIDGSPSAAFPVIYMYAYDLDMPNPNLDGVLIEGNTIATTGTPFQIYIRNVNYYGGTASVTGVQVHDNSLLTLKNLTSATIDASGNWWGSTDPTTVAGKISGTVDFTPLLNSGTDTDLGAPGFQPSHSSLTVHTLGSQTGSTGRIQEGINLVSGSTVNVAAGEYPEQVVINKNLTLTGIDNPTIQAPASPTGYKFPEAATNVWEPVVLAFGGTADGSFKITGAGQITVNISGITVDGNARIPSPTSRRAVGILFRNVVGGVEHSTVQNMGYSTASINSWGIMAYGSSDATFHGNTVSGYAKGGFVVNGYVADPSMPKPHAVVDDNTVTGPPFDLAMTLAPNGIQIGWGATGSVTNNTVTQNGFPGTTWGGTGILIQSSPNVLVEGNTASGNDYGIATAGYESYGGSYATGTIIQNNTVEDNSVGIFMSYRSVDTLVQCNTITVNVDGIQVGSELPSPIPPVNTDIHTNNIYGNTNSGLFVVTNVLQEEVDATANWWGAADGPGVVGPGSGDTVSTNVDFNPWSTVSFNGCTTAITLASFDAKPGNGKVTLIWETGTEVDNAGFNILRAESENGEYVQINKSLIPVQGTATQGSSYMFVDTEVKNRMTYYYKLQDIDLNGTATMHGPESATPRLIFGIGK